MKTKRESTNKPEGNSNNPQVIAEVADFHSRRMNQELKIKNKRKSANKPVGNYEYEQMIAEDADSNTRRLISEAAFFIAERRGFAPGNEMSDWLQAETEIEGSLRSAVIERRKGTTEDRRIGANLQK